MEVKEKIKDKVIELFLLKSCKDITMDEVARQIGISKRTLYENYANKEEMLYSILIEYVQRGQEEYKEKVMGENNVLCGFIVGTLYHIKMASQVKFQRLYELKQYYPSIFDSLFSSHKEFEEKFVRNLLSNSQKEGYLIKQISIEMIIKLLYLNVYNISITTLNNEKSSDEMFKFYLIHLFIILRGLCTEKGLKIFNDFCSKTFKKKDFENINIKFE